MEAILLTIGMIIVLYFTTDGKKKRKDISKARGVKIYDSKKSLGASYSRITNDFTGI